MATKAHTPTALNRYSLPVMWDVLHRLASDELTISYFAEVIERTPEKELTLIKKALTGMTACIEAELGERNDRKI